MDCVLCFFIDIWQAVFCQEHFIFQNGVRVASFTISLHPAAEAPTTKPRLRSLDEEQASHTYDQQAAERKEVISIRKTSSKEMGGDRTGAMRMHRMGRTFIQCLAGQFPDAWGYFHWGHVFDL